MLIQRNLLARAPFPLALRPSLSSFSTSRNLDNATSTMPLANLDTNRPLSSTNATAAAKDKQAAAKDRGACSTEPEQVAATQAFMALRQGGAEWLADHHEGWTRFRRQYVLPCHSTLAVQLTERSACNRQTSLYAFRSRADGRSGPARARSGASRSAEQGQAGLQAGSAEGGLASSAPTLREHADEHTRAEKGGAPQYLGRQALRRE